MAVLENMAKSKETNYDTALLVIFKAIDELMAAQDNKEAA